MTRLEVTITRTHGLVTVTLDGELDASNAPEVARALHAAVRLATHTLVVDALGLTFVDVAGRRALRVPSRSGIETILLPSPAVRLVDRALAAEPPVPQAA